MKRKWLLAIPLTGMLLLTRVLHSEDYVGKANIVTPVITTEPVDTIKLDTLIDANDTFSIINFKKYLEQKGIPHPHIVYAIARHESGFRSDLFLATNNMFGMKNPRSRETTSIHKGSGYARFEHWTHSVDDFYLYMKARGLDELTERQFISRLDQPKYYASRAGYGTRIKKHFYEYQELD